MRLPQIDRHEEVRLGDANVSAFEEWAETDRLENTLADDAELIIRSFIDLPLITPTGVGSAAVSINQGPDAGECRILR